jgi:hypothetical protein
MGLFRKKSSDVIDLRGRFSIPEIKEVKVPQQNEPSSDMTAFGFVGTSTETNTSQTSEYVDWNTNSNEERKTKLAKRLLDITNKMEDLSNQIYHMKQRLEIIERKLKINYD